MGDEATLVFDTEEARGRIDLRRGAYGAELVINGVNIGFIDLYPLSHGEPAQIIIDGPCDEPLAKIVLHPKKIEVVVHKNVPLKNNPKHGIHHDGDYVFYFNPEE